jgi:RND family efflux transporter MFP subunit
MTTFSVRLLLLAALFTGCAQQNEFQPPPPPQVTVSTPSVDDLTLYETFPGRVEARDSVRLVARVSGFLDEIHFEDGAAVKQGEVLFTIEPETYQAAVNAAKAQLAQSRAAESLAEASLSRKKRAFQTQAVSELDVLSAEADLEAAAAAVQASEARLEQAELNLSYTRITAPMDGVISKAALSPGNLVGPGGVAELALLVRVDVANVIFNVDERRLLPRLRTLAEQADPSPEHLPNVRLTLADGQAYPLQGRIEYMDNVIDESTGTLQVRAVFDNPDRLLFDGMFARVQIPVPMEDAMTVPETAIQRDLVGPFVYTLTGEGVVESTYIELGALTDGRRIVSSGLNRDDRVVVKGIQRVRPGVKANPGPAAAE